MTDNPSDSSGLNEGLDELFARMQAGDPAARREVFARLYDRLLALVRKFLRESFPNTGRDSASVVNDLYLALERAFADGALPPNPREFRKFAAFKLRQVLIDDARRRKVRHTVRLPDGSASQGEAGPPPDREPPAPPEAAQWREVHDAVGRLPTDQREVVELHLYLGLSQAEIAPQVGLTPKEVSRLWLKALTTLTPIIPQPGA